MFFIPMSKLFLGKDLNLSVRKLNPTYFIKNAVFEPLIPTYDTNSMTRPTNHNFGIRCDKNLSKAVNSIMRYTNPKLHILIFYK